MTTPKLKLVLRLLVLALIAGATTPLIVPLSAAGLHRVAGGWLLCVPLILYGALWGLFELKAAGRLTWGVGFGPPRMILLGLVCGGLILVLASGAALAEAYGLATGSKGDWVNRGVMIACGLFFALLGDQGAKTPAPLREDINRMRAYQRYYRSYGWVWVLLGLAMAVAGFVVPADHIGDAMLVVSVIAILATLNLCRRMVKARSA